MLFQKNLSRFNFFLKHLFIKLKTKNLNYSLVQINKNKNFEKKKLKI